jgi:hypothetical protein
MAPDGLMLHSCISCSSHIVQMCLGVYKHPILVGDALRLLFLVVGHVVGFMLVHVRFAAVKQGTA